MESLAATQERKKELYHELMRERRRRWDESLVLLVSLHLTFSITFDCLAQTRGSCIPPLNSRIFLSPSDPILLTLCFIIIFSQELEWNVSDAFLIQLHPFSLSPLSRDLIQSHNNLFLISIDHDSERTAGEIRSSSLFLSRISFNGVSLWWRC